MAHAKRFCLLTTGRTGSTSLMDVLASWDDVVVPGKLVPCVDNELVHPEFAAGYMRQIGELAGKAIDDEDALIETFFALGADAGYVGFKTMPYRHRRFQAFVARPDVRFIVLTRRDVTATVASFAVAQQRGSWRRHGGVPEAWTFREEDRLRVWDLAAYVRATNEMLMAVPSAIRLYYEDLCDPSFASPALDAFFARPVRLRAPSAPVRTEDYVTNHAQFARFVDTALRQADA
jgi:hypothetical protein